MKNANIVFTTILLAFACFGILPRAKAVSPTPDGGYPGGNTAEGQNALFSLTTGGYNTAVGFLSLRSDAVGAFNTAIGAGTLLTNTADRNTATGAAALLTNTTGTRNTANGALALLPNTIGFDNTGIGDSALGSNTTGSGNTAVGSIALANNTTGDGNIALGNFAGQNVVTANGVICIAETGADVSNSCFIGHIRGVTTINNDAVPVVVDSAGQLGTASSSKRFKKEIKAMDKASEAILALKPVSFHYKSDKANRPEFGPIAEEVAEVNPDLVVRDKKGEIYTVRYDAVNAMLLNEFLKEHRTVQELKATVATQRAKIAQQQNHFECKLVEEQKQIEALTSGLEKVTVRIQMTKPETNVALNNP